MSLYYVDKAARTTIPKYKYRGADDSFWNTYILGPLNRTIVNIIPWSLAPNTITLSGQLLILSSAVFTALSLDIAQREMPSSSLAIYNASVIMLYQLLDNLDGKQARRTGSSTALGFLFDHGCDVCTVTLSSIVS